MAAVKAIQIEKKMRITHREAVKFQVLVWCYIRHIPVSDADLDCLTLLAINGEQDLSSFCSEAASMKIFKNAQVVRNAVGKAEQKGLVVKVDKNRKRKRIRINPEMQIQTEGNMLLDFKMLALAS